MSHGIVIQPIIPGRKEASDKSEMLTQLLFGERYTVLEAGSKWLLVQNDIDGYQCWIDARQHHAISDAHKAELDALPQRRCGDAIGFLSDERGQRFAIPCSALLPGYNGGRLVIDSKKFEFDGRIAATMKRA
jgi:gamma-D-glutamyl-L-lysine dipeptidyl-peptidase